MLIIDRYKRAVADIGRVLEISGRDRGVNVGLANYQSSRPFSPEEHRPHPVLPRPLKKIPFIRISMKG